MNDIVFEKKELFAKDNRGDIRVWSIAAWRGGQKDHIIISMDHGVLGGEMTGNYEVIEEGLAGRTIEEQALSRINSRINKKIDGGYVYSEEEARSSRRVNALGMLKPMLAKPFKSRAKQIDWSEGIYIQRKYNGHRCLVTRVNGELIAYSRNGKPIDSIGHILDELEDLEEGETIDGELYHHGTKFQVISSWIKRNQPETKQLQYMIYDVVSDISYGFRMKRIKEITEGNKYAVMAQTLVVSNQEWANELLKRHRKDGYEGAILRLPNMPYEDGKRSNSLIKMKVLLDDEFLVTDIVPSAEGWAILSCVTKDGKRFSVSAPGGMEERFRIMRNKDDYVGRYVNVEYAEWTTTGKPFHPIATAFREKGAE